jgi:hypothetical protein
MVAVENEMVVAVKTLTVLVAVDKAMDVAEMGVENRLSNQLVRALEEYLA